MLSVGRKIDFDVSMSIKRTLTIPSRFEYLSRIADFIAEAGREAGFDEDTIFHVQMAVDEACSNVIEHAYQGQDQGDITLSCVCRGREWVVTVHDTGRPFDPQSIPDPNVNASLDNIKAGGLGLYFMRQLMDRVEFSFDEEKGNRLRMVKREV
jgi:anti-sigma regulatory factor (Ser/Thr protein kinase)